MPIYEFVCQECGDEFEVIQSFSDSSTPACPNCQGTQVQRRLSPPAIHFKGSGWYITDSKNSSTKSASGKNSSESAERGDNKSDEPAVEAGADKSAKKDAAGKGSAPSVAASSSSAGSASS